MSEISLKDVTIDNKCDTCTALCCGYFTQQVDTPTTIDDFDVLAWQIAHKGVNIFKDDNGWYLLSTTKCQFLREDNRCGIYETRPLLCRTHDNDECELDVPINEGCDYYFETYEQFDNYCRNRFKTWDKRFDKYEKQKLKEQEQERSKKAREQAKQKKKKAPKKKKASPALFENVG